MVGTCCYNDVSDVAGPPPLDLDLEMGEGLQSEFWKHLLVAEAVRSSLRKLGGNRV